MCFSSKAYAGFGIVSSVREGLYQDFEAVVMNERGSSILACGCGGGGGVRRFPSWKAGGRFDGDEDGWQDGFMVVGTKVRIWACWAVGLERLYKRRWEWGPIYDGLLPPI